MLPLCAHRAKTGGHVTAHPYGTAFFVLGLAACAHHLPLASEHKAGIDPNDPFYTQQLAVIASQDIPDPRRRNGQALLLELHSLRHDLNDYVAALQDTVDRNRRLVRKYGWTQGVVGGAAGITAPAALKEAWAVTVPVVLGIFNWIGLGTLKGNVEPVVQEGDARLAKALEMRARFDAAKDLFIQFAKADKNTAIAAFDGWATEASSVIKDVSQFMSRAPVLVSLR
jgi:hypothetical protein